MKRVVLPAPPRSTTELEFVATSSPCELCGAWCKEPGRVARDGDRWTLATRCGRCGATQRYDAPADADTLAPAAFGELGGPVASRLLSPFALVQEIDRLGVALDVGKGTETDLATWERHAAEVERFLTALNELDKHIPAGASEVPVGRTTDEDERDDRRARPQRYRKPWIEVEQARAREALDRIASRAPQLLAADPVLGRVEPPHGRIDRESLRAHREWLETGAGTRLDVVTADSSGVNLDSAQLSGARLAGVTLAGARLFDAQLAGVDLEDVDLRDARLARTSLEAARLRRCRLTGTDLRSAILDGAWLTQCTLADSDLTFVSARSTRFIRVDLRGAKLAQADFKQALFLDCDLRQVDLRDCDLERAQLVRCRLSDADGRPRSTVGTVLVSPDLSPRGDGSQIVASDGILGYWRSRDRG